MMAAEIGGMNSIAPLYAAAVLGIPMLDADGMGRAYPEFQMVSAYIYGCQALPVSIADEKGNQFICMKV